jgi:hypothetical protein
MRTRLRQIALAAPELDGTVSRLCEILGIEVAHKDPSVGLFGLHNAVMPIGDSFLEVVSPVQDNTTVGRLLAREGNTCGYMVIFQTDDLPAVRERAGQENIRIVFEVELDQAATVHLHPKDIGGPVVSFDRMQSWDDWMWGGPHWREHRGNGNTLGIVGAELAMHNPEVARARWSRLLPDWNVDQGKSVLNADGVELAFVPAGADAERLVSFTVAFRDPQVALERARAAGLDTDGSAFLLGRVLVRCV